MLGVIDLEFDDEYDYEMSLYEILIYTFETVLKQSFSLEEVFAFEPKKMKMQRVLEDIQVKKQIDKDYTLTFGATLQDIKDAIEEAEANEDYIVCAFLHKILEAYEQPLNQN